MKILIDFTDEIHCVEFKGAIQRAVQFHNVRFLREEKAKNNDLASYHNDLKKDFQDLYERISALKWAA